MNKIIENIKGDIMLSIKTTNQDSSIVIEFFTGCDSCISLYEIQKLFKYEFIENLDNYGSIITQEETERGGMSGYTNKTTSLRVDIYDTSEEMKKKVETICNKIEKYIKMMF